MGCNMEECLIRVVLILLTSNKRDKERERERGHFWWFLYLLYYLLCIISAQCIGFFSRRSRYIDVCLRDLFPFCTWFVVVGLLKSFVSSTTLTVKCLLLSKVVVNRRKQLR